MKLVLSFTKKHIARHVNTQIIIITYKVLHRTGLKGGWHQTKNSCNVLNDQLPDKSAELGCDKTQFRILILCNTIVAGQAGRGLQRSIHPPWGKHDKTIYV